MSGAELDRIRRNDEILKLYHVEKMSARRIGRIVGLTHPQVLNIIKQHSAFKGPGLAATIAESRAELVELLDDAIRVSREKWLDTLAAADLRVFLQAIQAKANLLGLNAPTSLIVEEVKRDYGAEWDEAFKKGRTIDGTFDERS